MGWSLKKILVTGADGFIGSHLVELLVEKGYSVKAFVHYNSFNSWGWLDEIKPKENPYSKLIQNVIDRPGHDKRYAINSNKIRKELNWKPQIDFEDGLKKTINWYLNNLEWANLMMKRSGYTGERIGKK